MEIRSVSGTSVSRLAASSIPEAVTVGTDESSADSTSGKASSAATAGYISPYLQYDQGARVAVMLFRDTDTGETQDQIPSRRVVEEYRRAAGRPQPETGAKTGSESSESSAAGQAGAARSIAQSASSGTAGAMLGISFASGGSAATSAGAVSFGASNGNAAPSVGISAPSAPVPVGGGSAGGSPGGLVSVTV